MNDVSLFLNTQIKYTGALAAIGDWGLTPVRYIFRGRDVYILTSFAEDPERKRIYTSHSPSFDADERSWPRFIGLALCLIPGLVLSVFKLMAYCFDYSYMIRRHNMAKKHFTPIERLDIGSFSKPITNIEDLKGELKKLNDDLEHRPINSLFIHGKNLEIDQDPGIWHLNPMKLILRGARLKSGPVKNDCFHIPSLHDKMFLGYLDKDPKWLDASRTVSSIKEALVFPAPRRDWTSCKRYHLLFS
jgi:hypothetical protein